MLDGTKLNVLSGARQLLRAFGGLNETYGCSEAELSGSMNFSSRGYPALQTRKPRRRVRQMQRMNGAYHLNGMLLCCGTGLEYTPDDGREAVVLENVLTDDRKELVGMGTRVLIWPDKKSFDTETGELSALGAAWALGDGVVYVSPCDAEGGTYEGVPTGETEPESPKDGQLFLKTGESGKVYASDGVLERYSEKAGKWVQILLEYVKLTVPELAGVIRAGDTVTVQGVPAQVREALGGLNGDKVVLTAVDKAAEPFALVMAMERTGVTERFYGSWVLRRGQCSWRSEDMLRTENESTGESMTLERRVPELDFVTECDNRVWGCSKKENVIYGCALGDPTNWYSYQGTAADSYAVTVGSDGPFTAAASCLGYVLFFKENCIHRLYGTKPSEYRLSSVRCRGVAANAGHSLCVIAETLYYLSTDGVMAWDGSLPVKVSAALDPGRMQGVDWTAAGYLDTRYYLYLRQKDDPAGRLLVYDTEKGLWHAEGAAGREMASSGRQLYLWDGSSLWAAEPDREADSDPAALDIVQFEAVSGDIGMSVPDDKYVSRVTLRVDAEGTGLVTLAVSYDGAPFEKVATCAAKGSHERLNLPFEPRRFDTMRIRLTGKGQMTLRSLALTLADSSGARVQGAKPRK